MKTRVSAFSRDNLLFTIPLLVYFGGMIARIVTNFMNIGFIPMMPPLLVIILCVLYFINPKKWVKFSIVITALIDFQFAVTVSRFYGPVDFPWLSWLFAAIPVLILAPMILHLIRTRKKPTTMNIIIINEVSPSAKPPSLHS